jgi:hypothetical protein
MMPYANEPRKTSDPRKPAERQLNPCARQIEKDFRTSNEVADW